jgi:hypothetical protein
MQDAVKVGNALNLHATPSYLVGPWAFDGNMPLERKMQHRRGSASAERAGPVQDA